ncbi:hypothetical protein GCM10009827_117940 [Dactylosporangium maewongense]|uniref:DUF2382 domain-containing protein n=1 Tax=Dactylosporangium maewongense TaxID=634393 RepID=A0ABP4PDT9_9ACTN
MQQPVEGAERGALDDSERTGVGVHRAALLSGGVDVTPQVDTVPVVVGTRRRDRVKVTLSERESAKQHIGRGRSALQTGEVEAENGGANQAVHGN